MGTRVSQVLRRFKKPKSRRSLDSFSFYHLFFIPLECMAWLEESTRVIEGVSKRVERPALLLLCRVHQYSQSFLTLPALFQ